MVYFPFKHVVLCGKLIPFPLVSAELNFLTQMSSSHGHFEEGATLLSPWKGTALISVKKCRMVKEKLRKI